MNGIYYGHNHLANPIYTKVSMNFKKLITFPQAMKLRERIDYALTRLKCKRSLERKTLILFLILISCLMNLKIFNSIITNLSKQSLRKTFGL